MKAVLADVDLEDAAGTIGLAGFGHLYAWGYGQNGRLGLVGACTSMGKRTLLKFRSLDAAST